MTTKTAAVASRAARTTSRKMLEVDATMRVLLAHLRAALEEELEGNLQHARYVAAPSGRLARHKIGPEAHNGVVERMCARRYGRRDAAGWGLRRGHGRRTPTASSSLRG